MTRKDYAPIYAALSAWDEADQPTGEQIDAIIAAYQAQQAQPERTWMFTISANFTAPTLDDAWDDWYDWLSTPSHQAAAEVVLLPSEDDVVAYTITGPVKPVPSGGWFCNECSTYFADDLDQCPTCGAPVDPQTSTATAVPTTVPTAT